MNWFIVGVIAGIVIGYILFYKRLNYEENNRKRLAGNYIEKFVPFLKKFKYNPADTYYFGGKPFDYIIFDGHSEGNIKKIVFIEVKTGNSQLTTRERLIKDAIQDKRIKYEVVDV